MHFFFKILYISNIAVIKININLTFQCLLLKIQILTKQKKFIFIVIIYKLIYKI